MKQAKSIIWGIAILALGVILGGKALGLFNFDIFFKGWWTLFLIIPGLIGLFTDKNKAGNLFFIAIGVILLLASQDVFGWDIAWKVAIAALFVLIGLSAIFKGLFHQKKDAEIAKKVEELKSKDNDAQVAVFSGNDKTYNKEEYTGGEIVAVFGGATLDIKNALIKKDIAIKAFCLFGGIDIIVPDDVQVKTKSGFIFGGINDERKAESSKGKHTIYLECAGGFGGVSLKDSKTKDN